MRIRIPFGKARPEEHVHAYVDGALSPRERDAFAARLTRDSALRSEVEAAQEIKALVAQVSAEVEPPRSFRLTPAMAASKPVATPVQPAFARWRLASQALAGAAGLLLIASLFGVTFSGSSGDDDDDAVAASAEFTSAAAAKSGEDAGGRSVGAATAEAGQVTTEDPTVAQPPATGGGTGDTAGGTGEDPAPLLAADTADAVDEGGDGPSRAWIGVVAGAVLLVAGLGGMAAFRRRERSAG
jgi:hypothetical protein